MRRPLLIWCLLLAGICCIAQSERVSAFWQSRDSNYNKKVVTGGGGGYTGPGDVVAATAWYGMRAYTAAKAGGGASTTKVADVTGTGVGGTCTIFLKGDGTGGVDLTTAGAGGSGSQCLWGATPF